MQMGLENCEVIIRLVFACAAGGILGIERSSKGIDAGFRTHILVCLSSCAIMIINLNLYSLYKTGDPTRMPAQVISGVGFLGVGCILVTKGRIRGVTTAAGLWSAACLGLCIGAGDYLVAVLVLVLICLTLTAFRVVDRSLTRRTKNIRFYAEFASASDLTAFLRKLQKQDMKIRDVEKMESKVDSSIAVLISLRLEKAVFSEAFIESLYKEGPQYLSKL